MLVTELRAGAPGWPDSLTNLPAPPKQLHVIGNVDVLGRPCVAIVGTRHPTRYGTRVASDISSALAAAGACIVSGMAYGIDACAHRAALENGGTTVAVLGAGVDQIYPTAHRGLYAEIVVRGAVISEFAAGTTAFRGCFPRRNRIIAGLSALTIVVEAGAKSGALITASNALDFDRKVAAVPGPIDSPQSVGTNQLLRDGAQVITCVDDALALLQLPSSVALKSVPPAIALGGDEAAVWDVVAESVTTPDDIVARTGLPADRCLVAVTNLEIHGLVECSFAGQIRRR